jgi:hypothetical protein
VSDDLASLLDEYDRALAYTDALWADLTEAQVHWRASEQASGIGWHLGHQAAVAHFMVRNLTAAEPSIDPELDALMDSATPEADRGALPDLGRLRRYRDTVADRVRYRIGNIDRGDVGAPEQLRLVGQTLLIAIVNHEYQHSRWISETRVDVHGFAPPAPPVSDRIGVVDGYFVVR